MVSISKLILSVAAFTVANGYTIPQLTKRDGKFLKLDFNVTKGLKGSKERFPNDSKSPFNISLANQGTYYTTNLLVGSEQDEVAVDVDTGSSDLWFPSSNSTDGWASDTKDLHSAGVFDAEKSTSFQYLFPDFFDSYGDGSFGYGIWGKDDVTVPGGGPTVNVQFGYAYFLTTGGGLLGIGLPGLEGAEEVYPNYPQVLKSSGAISKVAYSLYLNSADATSGSVLFGGIDLAKFKGSLTTLPIQDPVYLTVELDSISIGSNDIDVGSQVLLDSGTTITYLPNNTLNGIYASIPGEETEYGYKVYNPDKYTNSNSSISYHFKNATINVPISGLLGDTYDDNGNDLNYTTLQIFEGSILGDNFLRWAYVVYDLDDRQISLAPVKYTNDSNIVAIS